MTNSELDRLVAEKVFGDDLKARNNDDIAAAVFLYHMRKYPGSETRLCNKDCLRIYEDRMGYNDAAEIEQAVADYRRPGRAFATDPGMMMVLMEKLITDGWYITITGGSDAGQWFVSLEWLRKVERKFFDGDADTLPMAVALAALAAVDHRA